MARLSVGIVIAAAGAALATVFLVGAAAVRGFGDPDASVTFVVADVAVGVAFMAAALVARGDPLTRLLTWSVGASWLAASLAPSWGGVHQGLLLVALAAAGGLARHRAAGIAIVAVGATIASGLLSETAVAAAFVADAATLALVRRSVRGTAGAAIGAAMVVAGCLAVRVWLGEAHPDWSDPAQTLLAYEAVLVAVAATLAVTGRLRRVGLTGHLLADEGQGGLAGLSAVLARTLRDPSLRVVAPSRQTPAGRVLVVRATTTASWPRSSIAARRWTTRQPRRRWSRRCG